MLARILDDLKSAPARINHRRVTLTHKVRQSAHTARGTTEETLFDLRIGALTRVEGLLDKVDEVPVLKLVTAPAYDLAAARLAKVGAPALEDYDNLNARAIRDGLRDLTRIQLIALVRYETAHKARKTVLESAEKAIRRLDVLPEPAVTEPVAAAS